MNKFYVIIYHPSRFVCIIHLYILIYRHLNSVIDTSKTEISLTLSITIWGYPSRFSHYTLSDTAYHCWKACDGWHLRKVTVSPCESTYKKCLREEWGKFTGYQLLSSFWLKVARTDEDRNTTRWDRGTLPIRNLYPKWGMLRFGRMRKVTNWIWTLWFIVSYWWAT